LKMKRYTTHGTDRSRAERKQRTERKQRFDLARTLADLRRLPESAGLAIRGCYAMGDIALDPRSARSLARIGAPEAAVTALEKHPGHRGVAVAGFGAVAHLALDPATRRRLGDLSACEAVAEALRLQGPSLPGGVGFMAVANLALLSANRDRLGKAGACEAVAAALQEAPDPRGYVALGHLACHHAPNFLRVCGTTAPEAALAALSSGPRAADATAHYLSFVANLAWHDAGALGAMGACEAVTAVLKRNGTPGNAASARWCLAVSLLARNAANAKKLRDLGVHDAVTRTIRRHGPLDQDVERWGFRASKRLEKAAQI